MTFKQSVTTCFKKYCCLIGRASLSEYWWWVLFTVIVACVFYIPVCISAIMQSTSIIPITLYFLACLALFLPSLGVLVRRLHDIGRSGWWWFLGFVPLVGAIILIVFLVKPSQPNPNQYEPVPND